MNIEKNKEENKLTMYLSGRLDTNTAPEFKASADLDLDGVKVFEVDIKDLDYISSAGLRVLLIFHKQLKAIGGTFTLLHPKDEVMEVLDMTGFSSFLDIAE